MIPNYSTTDFLHKYSVSLVEPFYSSGRSTQDVLNEPVSPNHLNICMFSGICGQNVHYIYISVFSFYTFTDYFMYSAPSPAHIRYHHAIGDSKYSEGQIYIHRWRSGCSTTLYKDSQIVKAPQIFLILVFCILFKMRHD